MTHFLGRPHYFNWTLTLALKFLVARGRGWLLISCKPRKESCRMKRNFSFAKWPEWYLSGGRDGEPCWREPACGKNGRSRMGNGPACGPSSAPQLGSLHIHFWPHSLSVCLFSTGLAACCTVSCKPLWIPFLLCCIWAHTLFLFSVFYYMLHWVRPQIFWKVLYLLLDWKENHPRLPILISVKMGYAHAPLSNRFLVSILMAWYYFTTPSHATLCTSLKLCM